MLHYTVGAIILAMSLAGCAGKPSKEAPIETLGAKAAGADAASPVAVAPPVVAQKAAAAPVQTKKAVAEAGSTRPLRADEMRSKPLDAPAAKTESIKTESIKTESIKTEPAKSVVTAPVRPKARTFQFEYDSAALAATDHATLEAHGVFLTAQPKLEILVQGHADERGSREYNLALGQRRAESVKQALGLLGITDARIEAVSLGSEKPVTEGHDEAAWKQNRRAVLIYKDE